MVPTAQGCVCNAEVGGAMRLCVFEQRAMRRWLRAPLNSEMSSPPCVGGGGQCGGGSACLSLSVSLMTVSDACLSLSLSLSLSVSDAEPPLRRGGRAMRRWLLSLWSLAS